MTHPPGTHPDSRKAGAAGADSMRAGRRSAAPASGAGATPRSRAPKNLDTDGLLLTIEQWLGEAGAVNFSLRAAADAAGVSCTTLVRHFGSREGLIDALVQHRSRFNLDDLRRRVRQSGSLAGGLRQSLSRPTILPMSEARIAVQIMALALSASRDSGVARFPGYDLYLREVRQMLTADGLTQERAQDLAQFLLASVNGFIVSFANTNDEQALERNYRRLYSYILNEIDP